MTAPAAPHGPDAPVRRARLAGGARLATLGWAVTAGMGLVAISQALGFSWIPLLWTVQSFTPFVLAPAIPVTVVAIVRRRWATAAVHAGLVCCLTVLVAPVVTVGIDPPPATAPRLTVAHGNVYYRTDRPSEVAAAMVDTGADVLAMTEYSQPVADALAGRADVAERYPHVAAEAPGDRNGVALWSRHPIVEQRIARLGTSRTIDVTIDVDGIPVRILLVHPLPGTDRTSLASWNDDLDAIRWLTEPDRALDDASEDASDGAAASEGRSARSLPTMIVGDFNATRWHPAFRDLLGAGWRSAHEALGEGWSRSWPSDLPGPPLVRIDHALVRDGAIPTDVRDVALPGSDHLGFVVEVALVP